MTETTSPRAFTSNWLVLSGWIRRDGHWLGPATAALAGILAENSLRWDWAVLWQATLLVLLAELGWGSLWHAVAGTDWSSLRQSWQSWRSPGPRSQLNAFLPFTQPGSPAGRLARWWSDVNEWGAGEMWPLRGRELGAILIGAPVALALGAALGPEMLLATLGVLALCQLALFAGPGDGRANPVLQSLVEIGIPWLAGGLLWGGVSAARLASAAGLTLAHAGLVRVGRGRNGGTWMGAGCLILVLLLAGLDRPVAAMGVGALCFALVALLPWRSAGLGERNAVRLGQWPLLASMIVVAVAL